MNNFLEGKDTFRVYLRNYLVYFVLPYLEILSIRLIVTPNIKLTEGSFLFIMCSLSDELNSKLAWITDTLFI